MFIIYKIMFDIYVVTCFKGFYKLVHEYCLFVLNFHLGNFFYLVCWLREEFVS